MKCCGHERAGRFCSECGKPLLDDPLLRLLAHCHTQIKKQESQAAGNSRKHELHSDVKGYAGRYERDAKKATDVAKEWRERAEALTEILQQRATN